MTRREENEREACNADDAGGLDRNSVFVSPWIPSLGLESFIENGRRRTLNNRENSPCSLEKQT